MLSSSDAQQGLGTKTMSDGEEVDYSPDEPREVRRRPRRESSSDEEDALASVREVRRRRLEQESSGATDASARYEIPERIAVALKRSKTFNDYKNERTFRFLHLFSGRKDVLGREVLRQCHAEGLRAEVCALDRERDGGPDMLADQPYQDLVKDAAKGDFDASHAGYPCSSFSRVRYVETEGMPGPVRSLQHIYGLPTNTPKQQKEADQGTIMCVRSLNVTAEVLQAQRRRGVPEAATLENPPGSRDSLRGPELGTAGVQTIPGAVQRSVGGLQHVRLSAEGANKVVQTRKIRGQTEGFGRDGEALHLSFRLRTPGAQRTREDVGSSRVPPGSVRGVRQAARESVEDDAQSGVVAIASGVEGGSGQQVAEGVDDVQGEEARTQAHRWEGDGTEEVSQAGL